MQALLLPNLSVESLGSFKDEELHEMLITLIGNIFIPHAQNSKASNQLILGNLVTISEAISAFIVHPDTRISQKSIAALETLIKKVVAIEPSVITHLGDKLQGMLLHGLDEESSVVRIRLIELSCKLSLISAEVAKVLEPVN